MIASKVSSSVRGILLAEAILAAILFSAGVALVASSLTYQNLAAMKYQRRQAAVYIARGQMEQVLSAKFDELSTEADAYPQTFNVVQSVDGLDTSEEYRCEVRVTTSPSGEMRTILVEVTYEEQENLRSVRLETDVFWTS